MICPIEMLMLVLVIPQADISVLFVFDLRLYIISGVAMITFQYISFLNVSFPRPVGLPVPS